MTTTIIHDLDYLSRLQSSKSSSVVNIPAVELRDLTGCDDPTHLAVGYNFTANWLDNCVPSGVGLQASIASLVQTPSTNNGFSWNEPLAGVPTLVDGAKFTEYLLGGFPNGAGPININFYSSAAAVLTLLGMDEDDAKVKFVGSNINVYSKGSNSKLIATLSRPSISQLNDRCGTPVGYKASGNVALYGFNQETCRPELVWSQSQNLSYNSTLCTPSSVTTDVWTTYLGTPIFSQPLTDGVDDPEAVISQQIYDIYHNLLGATLVIGV